MAPTSRIPRPSSAPRASSVQVAAAEKENGSGGQVASTKRKQAVVSTTSRPPLKRANSAGKEEPARETWTDISEREGLSVDSLLAIRITGKNKFDFKGRCEQQMNYIKHMRACIRHLRDAEANVVAQQSELQTVLAEKEVAVEAARETLIRREAEITAETMTLKGEAEELEVQLKQAREESEVQLKEKSSRVAELEAKIKEAEEKLGERTREGEALRVERAKLVAEAEAQVAQNSKMQEMYNKANEYTASLQEYNAKLQSEAVASADALSKATNDKNAIQSEMATLQGSYDALQVQLATAITAEKEALGKLKTAEEDQNRLRCALDEAAAEGNKMRTELEGEKAALSGEVATLKVTNEAMSEQMKAVKISQEETEAARVVAANDLSRTRSEMEIIQQEKTEQKMLLESEKAEMQTEIAALKGAQGAFQEQVRVAAVNLEQAQAARSMTLEDLAKTRGELSNTCKERDLLKLDLEASQREVMEYKDATGKSAAEMSKVIDKSQSLEASTKSQEELIAHLRRDLDTAGRRLKVAEECNGERLTAYDALEAQCNALREDLADANRKILEGELVRRKLHNTIQELKGNIRVFCRVRPLMEAEEAKEPDECPTLRFAESVDMKDRGIELQAGPEAPQYNFAFDKVFQAQSKQDEVFEEISLLVQSALDGYKVCIFAYGQTGSGKTHTMLGSDDAPGMIPLSLQQIFETSEQMAAEGGWKFTMKASMLEIYNEEIKDLLGKGKVDSKTHTIKHDTHGNTAVNGLTVTAVSSSAQVSKLLKKAQAARSVGKTKCNERSSRSHMVFTLRIDGVNEGTGQSIGGVLNLIDLAGSERLSRSGATGDRLKETQAINKSLSALGDVIFSLHNNRDGHIPYRNSKLTYLLQPSLGGESKTLMFVNVAPTRDASAETLCSLRFAAKVNSCEVGTAKRQVKRTQSER